MTVNPSPVVVLGQDTTVCVFDYITLGSTGIGFDIRTVTVIVTSAEGCITTAQRTISFDFTACSGTGDDYATNGFHLYPNPGNGLIYLEKSDENGSFILSITDYTGRNILKNKEIIFSELNNQFILDLNPFPSGIYLLRLTDSKTQPLSFKYILNK